MSQDQDFVEEPLADGSGYSRLRATRWRNPTQQTVQFTLNIAEPRWSTRHPPTLSQRVTRTYVFLPTGAKSVPAAWAGRPDTVVVLGDLECLIASVHDGAIQKIVDGVIESGLAPQLFKVRDDQPAPKMHPSIDPATSGNGPFLGRQADPNREARVRARLAGAS